MSARHRQMFGGAGVRYPPVIQMFLIAVAVAIFVSGILYGLGIVLKEGWASLRAM